MRKFASIALALVAFNIFFFPFQKDFFGNLTFPQGATVGFIGFMISFLVFQYLAFFDSTDKVKSKTIFPLTGVALGLAVLSTFRTSDIDIVVLDFVAFVASMLSLYIFALPRGETIDNLFEVFISPIALFFESFTGLMRGLKLLRAPKLNLFKYINGGVIYVIAGVVIGLPLVFIIVALLSSANPVFSKFVENLIKFKDFPWWFVWGSVSRIFFSFFIVLTSIALAYLVIGKKENDATAAINYKNNNFALLATSVVLMVALVLGTYIVVEFPYLFANVAETQLKQFGVNTLSEYVTKGFDELMVVSILVYITSVVAMVIYKFGGKGSTALKWFNLILLSEAIVFITSIFRRVFIYQQEHGLTRIRIYGSVFLIGLVIWTIIIMARHSKSITKWFWYELSVFVLLALTIFAIRPDYLIANKFKPTVNKEVDYIHISRLSVEAVDGWIEGYKDASKKIETLEKKDRGSWTEEDERQAYYSFLTLTILRKNTGSLVLKYGVAEDMWDAKVTYFYKAALPDFKNINFTEKAALEKLKTEIGIKKLIEQEEKAYNILYRTKKVFDGAGFKYEFDNNNGTRYLNQKFDRSFESPLLPDIDTYYYGR